MTYAVANTIHTILTGNTTAAKVVKATHLEIQTTFLLFLSAISQTNVLRCEIVYILRQDLHPTLGI